jgi:hypothetical protein
MIYFFYTDWSGRKCFWNKNYTMTVDGMTSVLIKTSHGFRISPLAAGVNLLVRRPKVDWLVHISCADGRTTQSTSLLIQLYLRSETKMCHCCCSCRWGETISPNCGRQRPIVHPECDIWLWSHGGITLTGEKRWTRRETCPSATLSTTNPNWNDSAGNQRILGKRLANNPLSCGLAKNVVSGIRSRTSLDCFVF